MTLMQLSDPFDFFFFSFFPGQGEIQGFMP